MALNLNRPAPDLSDRSANPRRGRRPSYRLQRVFAWAAVIANGGIAVTGATVRVTGSGLGCPTWPECLPGSLVPVQREGLAAFHQAIEFGNRTLTGAVLIASLGAFVLVWLARPRRPGLLPIAAVGPAGVLFQAVWGGVVVRNELAWWTVAPHMLVSLALLFAAVTLLVRLGEPDGPARSVVPEPLRRLTYGTVGVLAALCVAGTLVTAAGPHGGDAATPRLDLPVRTLAQIHADLMFGYIGLLVALTVGLVAVRAPRTLRRRAWILVAVTAGQGLIGLVQFATGVPEALVVAHVLGAVLLTGTAATVALATRERVPDPAGPAPIV